MKSVFKIIVSAVIIIIASTFSAYAESACGEPVSTKQGPVVGIDGDTPGACAYKGIPYAAPPVGDLRWRPPKPAPKRSGVLEASEFGARCMQPEVNLSDRKDKQPPLGEDCLYLNIWRPDKRGKFPVMVWIHGGAFVMGSGSGSLTRGDRLAARQDVVVVTINYRLGPFGFLALPELSDENPHQSSGNYGVLDQTAALKWVRNNIAGFGGDPGNVTIFGQSAGGFSVCYQLATPLSAGLFHRAIMQSGSCEMPQTMEQGFEKGVDFVASLECEGPDVTDCMRSKPAEEIIKIAFKKKGGTMSLVEDISAWWPRVDGWSLVEEPLESLNSGNFNQVPFMAGYTRDEMKLFIGFLPKWILSTPKTIIALGVKRILGKETWRTIKKYYHPKGYSKPLFAILDYIDDLMFSCAAIDAAAAVSKYQPVYHYRFDYDDHREPERLGAAHAFDIPFIFDSIAGSFDDVYTDEQVKEAEPLVGAMMNYWANFARNADPNGLDLEKWPAFDGENMMRMTLDLPIQAEPVDICEICDYHRQRQNSIFKIGSDND